MTMKIGKLYSCSRYFLLIYPDKKTAATAEVATVRRSSATSPAALTATTASYWSKRLGKAVSYLEPKTPLLVLSVNEKYVEVLAEDKKGWIIYQIWSDIKEITDAAA